MKYAVVGAICLSVGLLLGAGDSRPAQKWKYTSSPISFDYGKSFDHETWGEANRLVMDQINSEEFVTAALAPDGSGWVFLTRKPVK